MKTVVYIPETEGDLLKRARKVLGKKSISETFVSFLRSVVRQWELINCGNSEVVLKYSDDKTIRLLGKQIAEFEGIYPEGGAAQVFYESHGISAGNDSCVCNKWLPGREITGHVYPFFYRFRVFFTPSGKLFIDSRVFEENEEQRQADGRIIEKHEIPDFLHNPVFLESGIPIYFPNSLVLKIKDFFGEDYFVEIID